MPEGESTAGSLRISPSQWPKIQTPGEGAGPPEPFDDAGVIRPCSQSGRTPIFKMRMRPADLSPFKRGFRLVRGATTDMSDSPNSGANKPPVLNDLTGVALFVDLDGTLVELQSRPEDVVGDAQLYRLLENLERETSGALAVVTGRSLADADRILKGSVRCVAALHGQEFRLHTGELRQSPSVPTWGAVKEFVGRLVDSGAVRAHFEDKGGAIALHYRNHQREGDLITATVDDIAERHGLRAIHGKMVSELLPAGVDKGIVLSTLMRGPPFAGRIPLALGDDTTDEDAFEAANHLGGMSVLVGDRKDTKARYVLPNVGAARAWLEAAL